MKKILSLLGTITLIGTSTTSLVACNTPQHEYTPEELAQLKKENKIKTNNQEIKDNLEWTAPQEKPFNTVDNKWYYVVWRGDKNNNWRIAKFQNTEKQRYNKFDDQDKYYIFIGQHKTETNFDIIISEQQSSYKTIKPWQIDNGVYFKSVYRWNLNSNIPDLIIDDKGNVKVKGE
ncbi:MULTISPECIES: lipoprotein [unclassified Spiroplasma]|uniref:lipoprotein n=1 Tax=unclassified Spiroplasma TaxID=2637901 RepID=UPI0030CAA2A0